MDQGTPSSHRSETEGTQRNGYHGAIETRTAIETTRAIEAIQAKEGLIEATWTAARNGLVPREAVEMIAGAWWCRLCPL